MTREREKGARFVEDTPINLILVLYIVVKQRITETHPI